MNRSQTVCRTTRTSGGEALVVWTARGRPEPLAHCHELRAFAPLGRSDAEAAFLAEINVPSMKHSVKSDFAQVCKSAASRSGTFSSLPSPTHCWKRWRQGYILDACQSVGQMKLDIEELKCDFPSVTGRKFLRGPRGTGFLYVSDKALQKGLEPLCIDMRGAEWIEKDLYKPRADATRFEDWEFAYALVLGMRHAIEYCLNVGEDKIWRQVKLLSDSMRRELSAIDRVKVLDRGPEVGGLVTFTVEGSEPKYLVNELLKRKINVVPSYRNFAVIDFDEKQVEWAIRASPHYFNTADEINEFLDALRQII